MLEDHSEEEEVMDEAEADAWNTEMEKKVMDTKNREAKVE